ncbi:hypothetical protein LUX33_24570 [Actinomadura madurae]|nr:hypothetical protein [Actinomadura madurae]MCP9951281.1 hypothetical protein [Actinomadura madurae]
MTVVGPGGVGKTRLVAAVAEQAASRFPAGGAFVDLVPVRTVARAGAVGQAVADALDVTEATQSVERAVFERLRLGRPLLVLDNCEHVIDEVSALAERVLATCPQATVLATSPAATRRPRRATRARAPTRWHRSRAAVPGPGRRRGSGVRRGTGGRGRHLRPAGRPAARGRAGRRPRRRTRRRRAADRP